MAIFANNSFAQSDSKDYSLDRLSKTFSEIDSKFSFMVNSSFKNGKLIITIERYNDESVWEEYLEVDKMGNTSPVKYPNEENIFTKDGKYGYVDKNGKTIIPPKYDGANDFSEGLASVLSDGKWGFINRNGETVVPFTYSHEPRNFSDSLACIKNDEGYGYINHRGEIVIPCIYYSTHDFSEGLAFVQLYEGSAKKYIYNKSKYINHKGETVISEDYYDAGEHDFHEGLAAVCEGKGTWAYINRKGETVIPYLYSNVRKFSDGLAAVMKNGKWGYINHKGKTVIPFLYDSPGDFSEGLAVVQKDHEWGVVDKNGKSTFDIK